MHYCLFTVVYCTLREQLNCDVLDISNVTLLLTYRLSVLSWLNYKNLRRQRKVTTDHTNVNCVWLIDVFVFYAAFNDLFTVRSRRFLWKLPALLVILYWHKPVSGDTYPQSLSPKREAITSIFKVFGMTWLRIEPSTPHPKRTLYHTITEYRVLAFMTLICCRNI